MTPRLAVLAAAASLLSLPPAPGQTPLDKAGPIGMNLEEFKDWNPAWVFTDAMKQARPFVSQDPVLTQPFDDGGELAVDADGWPLPVPGQAAASLLYPDMNGNYPAGLYDVFWDGTGVLVLGFDAVLSESVEPNHDRYLVTPTHKGILIKVLESDPLDPVRNIRLAMPGLAQSYETQTFHPDFLADVEPFGVLRMMQWQNTNFSTLVDWEDRPTPQDASQATELGVSLEYMVELGNVSGKALWFCMPRLATDDFVRQFAAYVAQNLAPEVPVYVEWSNEVWNGGFASYWQAVEGGQAEGFTGSDFDKALKWYSQRSLEVFTIWREELELVSGPAWSDRLVRVISGQHANAYVAEVALDHEDAYLECDAIAIGPYFGVGYGSADEEEIAATLAKTEAEILADLEAEVLGEVTADIVAHVAVAQARDLPLIAYEAGQHLVAPGGFFADPDLVAKFHAVNRDPGMYDVYETFLGAWNDSGGALLTPYSFTTRFSSWGSFGHLEYLGQPLEEAHKLRALLDYKDGFVEPWFVEPFGAGCQGLTIDSLGTPIVGSEDFELALAGASPDQPATLALSTDDQSYAGLALPLDLAFLEAPGCSLLVAPLTKLEAATDGDGAASLPVAIPVNPSLVGAEVFFQWYATQPGLGTLELAFSDGLAVTIGG